MPETTTMTARTLSSTENLKGVHAKIFVKDYVLDCHIGVFEEEQGVTQKVGFSIEAGVAEHVGSNRDDIADVPSYDDLTNAVQKTLKVGHINLVETVAEKIAAYVLMDKRFVWVRVRVEKLERDPGAVGIEIVRPRGCGQFV